MFPSDASPRYTVENLGMSTRITISAKQKGFALIYSGAKSVLWLIGELIFLGILYLSVGGFLAKTLETDILWFSKSGEGTFDTFLSVLAFIWLAVWTASGYSNTRTFLWQVAGKEILEISRSGIQLRNQFFGLGKVKEYKASEIVDLRLLEDHERTKKQPIAGPNMLAFDYEFDTVEFCGGLSAKEAEAVLVTIMKNYRQYAPDG